MDFATIIGLILGFVAVVVGMVVKGADITALLNPAAKINYFIGTFLQYVLHFR